ncbi:hypothetical protein [Streptomyces sp. ME19-01-6]|uniref:hypothetical protein n=1 Tax=Streptomyces sp. ME19-01-6 TaxID=3028686 RepID=UPI0029AA8E9B|nr:hypothetical protein [Streptomyces sp. ME19-01-6]MDX3230490.1 hypothetical protein [Streptomyces sp. ME19-01-6]
MRSGSGARTTSPTGRRPATWPRRPGARAARREVPVIARHAASPGPAATLTRPGRETTPRPLTPGRAARALPQASRTNADRAPATARTGRGVPAARTAPTTGRRPTTRPRQPAARHEAPVTPRGRAGTGTAPCPPMPGRARSAAHSAAAAHAAAPRVEADGRAEP